MLVKKQPPFKWIDVLNDKRLSNSCFYGIFNSSDFYFIKQLAEACDVIGGDSASITVIRKRMVDMGKSPLRMSAEHKRMAIELGLISLTQATGIKGRVTWKALCLNKKRIYIVSELTRKLRLLFEQDDVQVYEAAAKELLSVLKYWAEELVYPPIYKNK